MTVFGEVEICSRRQGAAEPEQLGDLLRLWGEEEWLIKGEPADIKPIADSLAGICESLADNLLLLDFRNAVGLFDVRGLGRVEVVTSKLDRHRYNHMLTDLMAVVSALPFSAGESAALPYDRSVALQKDVLYHAFVYLRHVLSDDAPSEQRLLQSLQSVLRDPHRRFERVQVDVPVECVRRIDSAGLVGIMAGHRPLEAVGRDVQSRVSLARTLKGHMPGRVAETRVQMTHDTPENRFVMTFLQGCLGLIAAMKQVAKGMAKDVFSSRLVNECEGMERLLRPIVQSPFWNGVGPMVHFPAGSTVLQRRRGYREVLRHFARLRLAARVPLEKELVSDLLEAKDAAQLYELWCYFSLVRALNGLLETQPTTRL